MIDAAACTHHGRQPRLFGPHSRVPPRLTARPPLRHYCVPCTPFWCTTHVPLAHRYIIYYAGRVDEAGSRGRAHTTTAGIPSTDRAAARTPRLPAILSSPPPGYASFDSLFSPLPRTHHRACHRRPDSDRGDTRQQSGDYLSGPEDRPTGLHHAEETKGPNTKFTRNLIRFCPPQAPFWLGSGATALKAQLRQTPLPLHTSWGRSP